MDGWRRMWRTGKIRSASSMVVMTGVSPSFVKDCMRNEGKRELNMNGAHPRCCEPNIFGGSTKQDGGHRDDH